MGRYANIEQDVYSIFASTSWVATLIKTFPSNFVPKEPGSEFVRVSVIPSGAALNRISASGILIIDIFIPAGSGSKRAALIADTLDNFLVNKTIATGAGSTQFGVSSLAHKGADKANPTLHVSSYTIPFNLFGVL